MKRLPVVLENLRIATPCTADWDEMRGDDRVRFCGQCEKNVYNLSAMSRAEAEALVAGREGRMCVRLYQRHDGTVLTSDCPVGAERARWRHRVWTRMTSVAASAMLAFGVLSGRARADLTVKPRTTASQPQPKPPEPPPVALMGGPAMPMPPPPEKRPEKIMGEIAVVHTPPAPPPKKQPQPQTRSMAKMGDVAYDPEQK
jgi:hypothetical protein